jgi:hypothetical protein
MEWCFAGFGGDLFHIMINSGKEQRRELKAPYHKWPFLPFEPKRIIGHGCDHEA